MFKVVPPTYDVKDVANALKITPSAVQKSIKRTGAVRGVKVKRNQGKIIFSDSQYSKIINTVH